MSRGLMGTQRLQRQASSEVVRMEHVPGELVGVYASLFVHCAEQYAVQQPNGSYWRVEEPLICPLLAAHLEGRWTLGTYLLDAGSCCAFAVFDTDGVSCATFGGAA